MHAPQGLRVEHLGAAQLGIGVARPRLSWRLPGGSRNQSAFEVEVDGDSGGRVEDPEHILVAWPGAALPSRRRVHWRVRVQTDLGQSEWSEPAWFETGLLHSDDWLALWIEPVESGRSPHVLVRDFTLPDPIGAARLYATAHGIYECFLNGRRVGDHELTPGFTSYSERLQVQAYDVTDLVVPGANRWEVVLTDGWYRGCTGGRRRVDGFGTRLGFLGQLEAGGVTVATGEGWDGAVGPLVAADLMAGQVEDHRRAPTDRQPVLVPDVPRGPLTWSPAPPVRRVEQVRPVSVVRAGPDRQVVDLGQNVNGWLRLTDLGAAGTELTVVHGEALDVRGDVTQENMLFDDAAHGRIVGPFQTDRVVSAGRVGDVFEPRHTTHGFRYARVAGHPGRLAPDDVSGVVVHTDLRRTGWFRCSDDSLNRLHDIVEWSFRDNACDIPTDCPQRERSGWTGDWQIFVPTAAFLYDVAGFSLKWLRDVAADQMPDGCVTNFAPDPMRRQDATGDFWSMIQGSSGWGDAVVVVPWELWRAYGDADVLSELWPAMVRWLDYAAEMARTRRHPSREAARPEPLLHEAFLWDGGFHWGEWCEPGVTDLAASLSSDQGSVGTAYLHRSASMAAAIARRLGHTADAERLSELAANALGAWRAEYIDADGALTPHTQATYVRALAFGLVPEDLRSATADGLVELIREAGTHLGTGFLATPHLLPVLAENGHLDLAYELLMQRTPPSWLAMVDRGATTVWELWEGVDADGVAHDSLNHYSKGAVISFLHRHVAGIQLLDDQPAYRRFRVAPAPGGGLTWARAIHDAPYGRIESSWRREGDRFELVVTVPPGAEAEVLLPQVRSELQGPGTRVYAVSWAQVVGPA
jgi:alpha-L-rhamnosidase